MCPKGPKSSICHENIDQGVILRQWRYFEKQTHQQWLLSLLCLFKYPVPDSYVSISVPKELSHRETPLPQHGAEQFGQVKPDVGNVDGHVIRLLQGVCKPGGKKGWEHIYVGRKLAWFSSKQMHHFQEV